MALKFLDALYDFLVTTGDVDKKICSVSRRTMTEHWFIYFDKDQDGYLSKEEFLLALTALLTDYESTRLDMVATFCPNKLEEFKEKIAERLEKQHEKSRRIRFSRTKNSGGESSQPVDVIISPSDLTTTVSATISSNAASGSHTLSATLTSTTDSTTTEGGVPPTHANSDRTAVVAHSTSSRMPMERPSSGEYEVLVAMLSSKGPEEELLSALTGDPILEVKAEVKSEPPPDLTTTASGSLRPNRSGSESLSPATSPRPRLSSTSASMARSTVSTLESSSSVTSVSSTSSASSTATRAVSTHGELPKTLKCWSNHEIVVTESDLDGSSLEVIPFLLIPNLKDWKAAKKYRLVLSLDGGGIRGTATIHFLESLEEALGHPLYEIFDMIAGTSTGAIQAALIGSGRTCKETREIASTEEAQKAIFPHPPNSVLRGPKYDGKGKSKMLNLHLGDVKISETKVPLLITTFNMSKMEAWLWTTRNSDARLADIVDASSAAPTYFPPVKIDKDYFVDGGVNANDPSMCALVDAMSLWPGEEIRLLSVGTGLANENDTKCEKAKDFGLVQWMTKGNLLNMMMDTTLAQKQVKAILQKKFLRVNSYLKPAGCDTSMDDRDPRNVDALANLGKKWWNFFAIKVLNLILDEEMALESHTISEKMGKFLRTDSAQMKNPFTSPLNKVKINVAPIKK